jgi:hypothetical protein
MVCGSKIEGESTAQHTAYRHDQRVPVSKSELVLIAGRKIWFDFGHVVEASEKTTNPSISSLPNNKKIIAPVKFSISIHAYWHVRR